MAWKNFKKNWPPRNSWNYTPGLTILQARRAGMDEWWHESLFQISGVTDENDLHFVVAGSCLGTHDKEEEEYRSNRICPMSMSNTFSREEASLMLYRIETTRHYCLLYDLQLTSFNLKHLLVLIQIARRRYAARSPSTIRKMRVWRWITIPTRAHSVVTALDRGGGWTSEMGTSRLLPVWTS